MVDNFTNEKPYDVDQKILNAFTRGRRRYNCALCGQKFAVGDRVRWLCANMRKLTCGNFHVCSGCDGPDDAVLASAQASYDTATKLAKQWDIYGPDWQE